jgi:hypothetical protein
LFREFVGASAEQRARRTAERTATVSS